jgi:hypothetical protein
MSLSVLKEFALRKGFAGLNLYDETHFDLNLDEDFFWLTMVLSFAFCID